MVGAVRLHKPFTVLTSRLQMQAWKCCGKNELQLALSGCIVAGALQTPLRVRVFRGYGLGFEYGGVWHAPSATLWSSLLHRLLL